MMVCHYRLVLIHIHWNQFFAESVAKDYTRMQMMNNHLLLWKMMAVAVAGNIPQVALWEITMTATAKMEEIQ
jgi:hypothetical protein